MLIVIEGGIGVDTKKITKAVAEELAKQAYSVTLLAGCTLDQAKAALEDSAFVVVDQLIAEGCVDVDVCFILTKNGFNYKPSYRTNNYRKIDITGKSTKTVARKIVQHSFNHLTRASLGY